MDSFDSIRSEAQFELLERKSRFIAFIYPVDTECAAQEKLANLRKIYYNAAHYCWSVRLLGDTQPLIRFSDDGEPSRSAGFPISLTLEGANLFNTLICVVRYFGGIKLGTGGLVKAYTAAAQGVIDLAERIAWQAVADIQLVFHHEQTGLVMRMVNEFQLRILTREYSDSVICHLQAPIAQWPAFQQQIEELSAGGLHPVLTGRSWISPST